MNAKTIAQAFTELSTVEQAKCLAAWMHAATVDARDTYIPGTEAIADPVRLRYFNELQHQISSRLMHALDKSREIDELSIAALWEGAKELRASVLRTSMEKIATSIATSRRQRRAG